MLLTGAYDRKINVLDIRDQSSALSYKLPSVAKDIESAQWHFTMEHNFVVSTESGIVFGFDTRKFKEPLF